VSSATPDPVAAKQIPHATLGTPQSAARTATGKAKSDFIALTGAMAAADTPVSDAAELSIEALIEAVLARNPIVAEKVAAWQAVQARYPQQISLDDPMFNAAFGPGTIGSNDVNFAYRLELAQKYPWHGKLALRGQFAQAEASAAGHEVEDVRLQLVESTRAAFYDYYLAERALEVNAEALKLLKEFRDNAQTRFTTGQAPQQDVLQADVEIGRQQERQLTLQRMRAVAIARINTLLHLPTDSPLPAPPKDIKVAAGLPDVRDLQARAVASRPDLRALADRLAAAGSSLALAYKEYYPDLEPYVMYDTFMGNMAENRDMALQLGVRLNLPVRKSKRAGLVAEAQAKLAQQQAELARLTDQVNFEVQQAHEQVREGEGAVKLYEERILPAARENVKAALTAYVTNKVPFLSLIEAERNLVGLRDRYYETLADVLRRRATLERVTGGSLVPVLPTGVSELHAPTPVPGTP
jgi:outer membrane protein TolC